MTSRTAQKRDRTRTRREAADPLERALRSSGPRCACRHGDGRCRRRATHRASAICAVVDCRTAVHVTLLCDTCKDEWVRHSSTCRRCPELRVAPL